MQGVPRCPAALPADLRASALSRVPGQMDAESWRCQPSDDVVWHIHSQMLRNGLGAGLVFQCLCAQRICKMMRLRKVGWHASHTHAKKYTHNSSVPVCVCLGPSSRSFASA